ncbi:MAG: AraC family transcriptional regulator [Alkalispirochaeta sp.]
MNWHDRMNAAVDYIEDNLTGTVDIWEAAKITGCSEYHFRRMFSFIAGIPVSEYVRRRRLTLAALDLRNRNEGVEDVAGRYGYRSTESFARAFTAVHGLSPATAQTSDGVYRTWPRMTFYLTIQGGRQMDVRITDKGPFRIIGIMKRVPIRFEGINPEIEAMWKELTTDDIQSLKTMSDTEPEGIIQASVNFDERRMDEQGSLDHYIGVASTKQSPGPWSSLDVAASTWAAFSVTGPFPQAMQETWGRIYSEWFPSVEYQLSEGPEILSIKDKDLSGSNVRCDIWIPIKAVR